MAFLFDETTGDSLAEPVQNTVLRHSYGPGVFNATTAPGTGDDELDGYRPNSLWYDATGGKLYLCIDSTTGAAVWKQVVLQQNAPIVPLKEWLTDANGTDYTTADAYSYTVPANTLTVDGQSIRAFYSGTLSASMIASVEVMFAGTSIFWSDEISTIGDWRLDVDIVRTSSTAARCSVAWHYAGNSATDYTVVSTGLDFTTGEILKLRLYAEDLGNKITAKVGKIWKMGAS